MTPLSIIEPNGRTPATLTRYRLTPAGHFAVTKRPGKLCVEVWHVPSGLRAAVLSHLAYRVMAPAIERLATIERQCCTTLDRLRVDHTDRPCLLALKDALLEQFAGAMG